MTNNTQKTIPLPIFSFHCRVVHADGSQQWVDIPAKNIVQNRQFIDEVEPPKGLASKSLTWLKHQESDWVFALTAQNIRDLIEWVTAYTEQLRALKEAQEQYDLCQLN